MQTGIQRLVASLATDHRSASARPLVLLPLAALLALVTVPSAGAQQAAPDPFFVEAGAESGLDFVHFNGMSGEMYIVENMGSGAGLLDYDGDGDLDLYLVQGTMLGHGKTTADALFAPHHPEPLSDRLYRNDLAPGPDGRLEPRLVDVTAASGIAGATGYGMGVATGDYDRDGWLDLYVTNFGANQLWHNNADGTFTDVTEAAGVADTRWSVPAVFFDFDRDGWLDLWVGNYLDFIFARHRQCPGEGGQQDYCGPLAYRPEPDRLFRNRADGTFADVTRSAGLDGAPGNALGAVSADLNADGWPDLYVTNDRMPNLLWINHGGVSFIDEALLAGCAVNWEGHPEASMGVDAGDFDGDGDDDLFMTHLTGETNTLYLNDGEGLFRDRTMSSGLDVPSRSYTSFGTLWVDFDNDGWLDLLIANGAVRVIQSQAQAGDPLPLKQPNQLFRNLGDGRFQDVTEAAGEVFALQEVSRGAAFGDLDNDGDADVLLSNNAGPARLLQNELGHTRDWIGLRMHGVGGPAPSGTRVAVQRGSLPTLWRRVRTDGSYASANDARVLVGLGEANDVSSVRLTWADGSIVEWRRPPTRTYLTVRRDPSGPGAASR